MQPSAISEEGGGEGEGESFLQRYFGFADDVGPLQPCRAGPGMATGLARRDSQKEGHTLCPRAHSPSYFGPAN